MQCGNDFIGGCRLGQIMYGTQLDGFHGGCHAGVPGQHDNAGIFIECYKLFYQFQTGFGTDAQVHNGIFRFRLPGKLQSIFEVVCNGNGIVAIRQGIAQHFAIDLVVIDQ